MGTWGINITKDDTVADIIGYMTDQLKLGNSVELATEKAKVKFAQLENDSDEAPLLWLAIAHVQWKYGTLASTTLKRVQDDITNERGLERWREDQKLLSKRKLALTQFLLQIQDPNPKPSKPPKLIIRKALFKEGDCLQILLADGRYTAAFVLKADNSNPEYGKNLIASLDYLSTQPPTIKNFKRKNWLILSHGNWKNTKDIWWYLPIKFKLYADNIKVVGNISVGWFPPKSDGMSGWHGLGEQILLEHAHRVKQLG